MQQVQVEGVEVENREKVVCIAAGVTSEAYNPALIQQEVLAEIVSMEAEMARDQKDLRELIAELRERIRELNPQIRARRYQIKEALLQGAEVQEGPHFAWLERRMKKYLENGVSRPAMNPELWVR